MIDFTEIPFNDITKFGQQTMLDTDLFSISWILGRFCNYKCSYCWPYANSQTPDYLDHTIYWKTINNIKEQAKQNGFNKFHWSFSGGEPTAYRNLLDLVVAISGEEYVSIHMTTNLSPSINWWTRWIGNANHLNRASITASFHSEFADENEFIEKCLYLMNNEVFVTVNQVMVPEHFYQSYERCLRMYEKGINVTLKPQSNTTATDIVEGYTEDMIQYMRTGFPQHIDDRELFQVKLIDSMGNPYYIDQAERFNSFGFNKFSGWTCNSGYQSVIIRGDEVKRSYSCHDDILGTLTQGFKLFESPRICITPNCVSSADSKIPKCKSI